MRDSVGQLRSASQAAWVSMSVFVLIKSGSPPASDVGGIPGERGVLTQPGSYQYFKVCTRFPGAVSRLQCDTLANLG